MVRLAKANGKWLQTECCGSTAWSLQLLLPLLVLWDAQHTHPNSTPTHHIGDGHQQARPNKLDEPVDAVSHLWSVNSM